MRSVMLVKRCLADMYQSLGIGPEYSAKKTHEDCNTAIEISHIYDIYIQNEWIARVLAVNHCLV